MTDFIIPCETIYRLSRILITPHENATEWTRTLRIDHGAAIVTNRSVIVIERVIGGNGIAHLHLTLDLIEQCRKEAAFKSSLTITVNEALRFATAKTSLGYIAPGNCCMWSTAVNELDRWKEIAEQARPIVKKSKGAMFWNGETIAALAGASPSGAIVFPEHIDISLPVVVRDAFDPDWVGLFCSTGQDDQRKPARLPDWV